jgi:hypothetical protein
MTELLFDTPWWLPAVILAAGVVIFITGNRRVEPRVRVAGIAVIAAGILLAAVSYFVDTPRETAERKTIELAKDFEKADWPGMSAILDARTAVTVMGFTVYDGRDKILANAKDAHAKYGFKTVRVLSSNAEQNDTSITVTLVLLTEQTQFANTLNSTWAFEWRETKEGWTLVEVRAIQIGQQTGDQIKGMMPSK